MNYVRVDESAILFRAVGFANFGQNEFCFGGTKGIDAFKPLFNSP